MAHISKHYAYVRCIKMMVSIKTKLTVSYFDWRNKFILIGEWYLYSSLFRIKYDNHFFYIHVWRGNLSHLLPGRKIQNTIKAQTDVHNHEMTVIIEINIRNSRAKETLDFWSYLKVRHREIKKETREIVDFIYIVLI